MPSPSSISQKPRAKVEDKESKKGVDVFDDDLPSSSSSTTRGVVFIPMMIVPDCNKRRNPSGFKAARAALLKDYEAKFTLDGKRIVGHIFRCVLRCTR